MSIADEKDAKGFLSRWSQRKLAQEERLAQEEKLANEKKRDEEKREAGDTPPAPAPAGLTGNGDGMVAAATDAVPFDVTTLPSLDDLTGESSVSLFMQAGVPEALKNAALRKVWSANPFIRDDTGPVDYGWNFNDPTAIPGFGPIGEGTDIASLLRQAIGEVEPVTQAPIDIAVVPETPENIAQGGEEHDPEEPVPAAYGLENKSASASASPASAETGSRDDPEVDGAPQPPLRPKHGGAMPA